MGQCNLKDFINSNCYTSTGKLKPVCSNEMWWLKRNQKEYYDFIIKNTNFLDSNYPFAARIFCVQNNLQVPKCKVCGSLPKYDRDAKCFRIYCSPKCKIEDSTSINETIKNTVRNKYGFDYVFQTKEFKDKVKNTSIKRYGTEHHTQAEDVKNKIKKSNINKYGSHPSLVDVVQQRRKNTLKTKYNTFGPRSINREYSIDINDYTEIYELYTKHVEEEIPVYQLSREIGLGDHSLSAIFKKHNLPPKHFFCSKLQKDFAESIGCESEMCNRSVLNGAEIDIFYKDYSLGVEIDGIYWHTNTNPDYHNNKVLLANSKNIRLIRFNEIELKTKPDICRGIVLSGINKTNKIYARNCEVVKVDTNSEKKFLNENHIQGSAGSKVCYGLVYNNILVSVMSFGKSRFNKNYEWEMLRSCSLIGTTVVGGASKLFSRFIKEYTPSSIISYADRRHFTGESYVKYGFKFSHSTKPGYFYWDPRTNALYNRIKFQKHKLINMLVNYDCNLTEKENMLLNGYRIYYDCGQNVYTWRYYEKI